MLADRRCHGSGFADVRRDRRAAGRLGVRLGLRGPPRGQHPGQRRQERNVPHKLLGALWDEGLYDGVEGAAAAKVCSDNLFAFSKKTGAIAWTYTDGVIINSTITIGAGRVYFVETRNAKVQASSSRRVSMPEMWLDQFLVALDVDSGAKVWEGPIDTVDGEAVIFLAHGQDRLVLVSSGGPPTGKKNQYGEVLKQHYVYAYDPSNGDAQWETSFEWTRPRKAEHMSRPVIVGETLFIRPHVLNLTTGKSSCRSGCRLTAPASAVGRTARWPTGFSCVTRTSPCGTRRVNN